jgi:SHS2 domain-containing protein
MRPFEIFEHTADIGLVARGATLEELFSNAAMGLVDLIVDPAGLQEERSLHLSVTAQDRDALLVRWLNELLYVLDTTGFVPKRTRVTLEDETGMAADLWGEQVNRDRHVLRRMVKAATYHGLRITQTHGAWEARIILDL